MPRGDGTGPLGQGPLSGRGAGYCAGYAAPGFASRPAYGRGGPPGGMGAGFGGGHGHRNRFYATGVPFSAYAPGPGPLMGRDEEISLLTSEAERMRSVLETIDQRLEQLKAT
jgi:hypothetical protein